MKQRLEQDWWGWGVGGVDGRKEALMDRAYCCYTCQADDAGCGDTGEKLPNQISAVVFAIVGPRLQESVLPNFESPAVRL